MCESIASLEEIRGMLNEALRCLDEGMAMPNIEGYDSLARARERLMNALAKLAAVEKRLTEQVRRGKQVMPRRPTPSSRGPAH